MDDDYGRSVVLDSAFEAVAGEAGRAIREEGLQVIARVDVRDRFWRDLGYDFRQYLVLEVWSPELALRALRHDLEAGTVLPATFAIYEVTDGRTAVVLREPFAPIADDPAWRGRFPDLAAIADEERRQIARAFERMRRAAGRKTSSPAA